MNLSRRQFLGYTGALGLISFMPWRLMARMTDRKKWSFPKKPLVRKNIKPLKNNPLKKNLCPLKKTTGKKGRGVFIFKKGIKKPPLLPYLNHRLFRRYNQTRVLSLYYSHTGEKLLNIPYFDQGGYNLEACSALNRLLRDHRSGDIKALDYKLYDLLFFISKSLGIQNLEAISGYRSIKTNNYLRKNSRGVAKNSYHIQGKAIDLRCPSTQLRAIAEKAKTLRLGGIGCYRRSGFIHLDVRGSFVMW